MSDSKFVAGQTFKDCFYKSRDGLELHFRDYPGAGDRPPILCLHGLTRNARDWANFAERYCRRFRVIVPEFRGRGESAYDPQPARYNPLTYAGDMIELLDQLEIRKAIFVGTSLGGLVTMTIAARANERIAATILNDIGPDVDAGGVERILSYVGKDIRFSSWEEAARAIAANQGTAFENYSSEDWIRMAMRNCRKDNGEIRFDYDMAIADPFRSTGPTPNVDLWPLFATLAQKPLLVVRGAKSDLLTAATAATMQMRAPHMKLTVVPGVGHAPDLNEPEALAAIDEFLAELC